MYRLNSKKGYLLLPCPPKEISQEIYKIKDTEGKLTKLGLTIPQKKSEAEFYFKDFKEKMRISENDFIKKVNENA
jgi:hypothetical protein